jgi:hypothetical protein
MSPSKNVFMMGPEIDRLRNFKGIYISPDQGTKKPISKKKTGVDIRYKIRDLELASAMTSDDFFLSSESEGTPTRSRSHFSGKKGFKSSSQALPEEIVEDHVNQ